MGGRRRWNKGNRRRPAAFGTPLSPAPMPARIPDPLPARFTASLVATVRCTVEHALLADGRAEVEEEGVAFEAHVDTEAGTVRVVGFPEIEAEVGTAIGRITTAVRVEGEPEGTYDAETGRVEVEAVLTFDPSSLLARSSDVSVTLRSDARLADPKATGDPLEADDTRVVLVGEGLFEGGSVDGGRLGLVLDCRVAAVEAG